MNGCFSLLQKFDFGTHFWLFLDYTEETKTLQIFLNHNKNLHQK
jgi:hypothetical protein